MSQNDVWDKVFSPAAAEPWDGFPGSCPELSPVLFHEGIFLGNDPAMKRLCRDRRKVNKMLYCSYPCIITWSMLSR
jgi:hypothetical protein